MSDKYAFAEVIGKGVTSTVFSVYLKSQKKKKKYVLKRMRIREISEDAWKYARNEYQILKNINHPNIVKYIDSFEEGQYVSIVMEYCEKGELAERLKNCNGKLLSEKQVKEWLIQITMALKYLHDRNILHRDLKCQNIFITASNTLKVGDLGVAKQLESSYELARTATGTPYYMSPEKIRQEAYDKKSDIWALGCVAFEMVALKHAFEATTPLDIENKILNCEISDFPDKYSRELVSLIKQMLSSTPQCRPTTEQILNMPFIQQYIQKFLMKKEYYREHMEYELCKLPILPIDRDTRQNRSFNIGAPLKKEASKNADVHNLQRSRDDWELKLNDAKSKARGLDKVNDKAHPLPEGHPKSILNRKDFLYTPVKRVRKTSITDLEKKIEEHPILVRMISHDLTGSTSSIEDTFPNTHKAKSMLQLDEIDSNKDQKLQECKGIPSIAIQRESQNMYVDDEEIYVEPICSTRRYSVSDCKTYENNVLPHFQHHIEDSCETSEDEDCAEGPMHERIEIGKVAMKMKEVLNAANKDKTTGKAAVKTQVSEKPVDEMMCSLHDKYDNAMKDASQVFGSTELASLLKEIKSEEINFKTRISGLIGSDIGEDSVKKIIMCWVLQQLAKK